MRGVRPPHRLPADSPAMPRHECPVGRVAGNLNLAEHFKLSLLPPLAATAAAPRAVQPESRDLIVTSAPWSGRSPRPKPRTYRASSVRCNLTSIFNAASIPR